MKTCSNLDKDGKKTVLSPSFTSWLLKCESAIQPRPHFDILQAFRANDRILLNSTVETKSDSKDQIISERGRWGWWKIGNRDDRLSSPIIESISKPTNKNGIFDDLLASMNPIKETEQDKSQRERSEKYMDKLIRYSPMIRFMIKHLNIVGCSPFDKDGFVEKIFFAKCSSSIAGGFMPSQPNEARSRSGLLICYDKINSKSHMEQTLAHEMIHWFDHCRFKADWSNLRHIACSEIRAASLSGDCRFFNELGRGMFGVRKHHQKCARRRAIISMVNNPDCPDEQTAARIVDEVFESCFNDTRPFDEIY
ncbi:hypothetical protein L7F22_009229 [Adiantum nelumboides]|nr:hypothetical protein [Adiantum nelumboides]